MTKDTGEARRLVYNLKVARVRIRFYKTLYKRYGKLEHYYGRCAVRIDKKLRRLKIAKSTERTRSILKRIRKNCIKKRNKFRKLKDVHKTKLNKWHADYKKKLARLRYIRSLFKKSVTQRKLVTRPRRCPRGYAYSSRADRCYKILKCPHGYAFASHIGRCIKLHHGPIHRPKAHRPKVIFKHGSYYKRYCKYRSRLGLCRRWGWVKIRPRPIVRPRYRVSHIRRIQEINRLRQKYISQIRKYRSKYIKSLNLLRKQLISRKISRSKYTLKIKSLMRSYRYKLKSLKQRYNLKLKLLMRKPSIVGRVKTVKKLKELSAYKRKHELLRRLSQKEKLRRMRVYYAKLARIRAMRRARRLRALRRLQRLRWLKIQRLKRIAEARRREKLKLIAKLQKIKKLSPAEKRRLMKQRISLIREKYRRLRRALLRKIRMRKLMEARRRRLERIRRLQELRRKQRLKRLQEEKLRRAKEEAIRKAREKARIEAEKRRLLELKIKQARERAIKKAREKARKKRMQRELEKKKIEEIKKAAFREGVRKAKQLIPKKVQEEIQYDKDVYKKQLEKLKKYEDVLRKALSDLKEKQKELDRKKAAVKTSLPSTKMAIQAILNDARAKIREARNMTEEERAKAMYIIRMLSERLKEERARKMDIMETAKLLETQIIQVLNYRDRLTNALNKIYEHVERIKPKIKNSVSNNKK